MGLGVFDKISHVVDAQFGGLLGVHDHHVGHTGHQRDRRKVLLRVIRHLAVQRFVDAMGAHRAHQQGVAIPGGFGHEVGADIAAGTGPVVHDEGLAESLGQLGRHGAGQDVGGAARRKWHDDAHRLGRPGALGDGRHAHGARQDGQASAMDQAAPVGSVEVHGVFLWSDCRVSMTWWHRSFTRTPWAKARALR